MLIAISIQANLFLLMVVLVVLVAVDKGAFIRVWHKNNNSNDEL